MYGLIGKIRAVPGQRDALASLLIQATSAMPGCLSYIVAADLIDPDALWVTEVWDSSTSHRASLNLPAVQQAIAKRKPLIAGFGGTIRNRASRWLRSTSKMNERPNLSLNADAPRRACGPSVVAPVSLVR